MSAKAKGSQYQGLEFEENERAIRRDWRFERIGRMLLALILLAAIAGLLGRGPLAKARTTSRSGALTLDYERIERRVAETHLRFSVAPGAVTDTLVRLWIDRRWLEEVRLEQVVPEPIATRETGTALVYEFAATRGAPAVITFDYQHEGQGRLPGSAGLVGADSLRFAQFVLP